MSKKHITKKDSKQSKNKASKMKPVKEIRSKKISFRTTPANFKTIHDKAEKSGISISKYMEQVGIGNHPRRRLTDKECDALMSLTDARADLVNIRSALKGKSYEQKLRYFRDENFMKRWIAGTDSIINRWYYIEENILN